MPADACTPSGRSCRVESMPPTTATVTGAGSLLVKERMADVAWLFTSLMPKISAWGKEAETLTARFGVVGGESSSCSGVCVACQGHFQCGLGG